MSIEAMTWALNANVGDATRKLVLIGYANHAHKDGRNAWAAKSTVAEYVNCSVKTVTRHVQALIADGWLREGDQQQVAHLRADRRPVVYDLAMTEATRREWAEEASTGRTDILSPRDAATTAGDSDERGDNLTGRDGAHGGTHGGTPVTERGDTAVSHKPSRTKELPPTPPASGGPATAATHPDQPRCQRHTTPQPNCRGCGTTNRQLAEQARRAKAEQARRAEAERFAQARATATATSIDVASPTFRGPRDQARACIAASKAARKAGTR